jgi:hypothetical protein
MVSHQILIRFAGTKTKRGTCRHSLLVDFLDKAYGTRDVDSMVGMREPKIVGDKLECTVCKQVFDSRQDYDNHWLSCHQDLDANISMASGSMGSMQPSGEESCKRNTS